METEMTGIITVYDGYARALEDAMETLENVYGSLRKNCALGLQWLPASASGGAE